MMKIQMLILLFISSSISYSQCCCSYLGLNFVDSLNRELTSRITIKNLYPNKNNGIIKLEKHFRPEEIDLNEPSKNYYNIPTQCGFDSLVLQLTDGLIEMELKIYDVRGDSPVLLSDITFRNGSFSFNLSENLRYRSQKNCCKYRTPVKSDATMSYLCDSYPRKTKIGRCNVSFNKSLAK